MSNASIIRPQANGRLTVTYYMRLVQHNLRNSVISMPDPSRIRVAPTLPELRAYKREIERRVAEGGKTKADASICLAAARALADKMTKLGTADYTFGLRPGSDDPLHYGHVSAGLAAILFLNSQGIPLNGCVFATGGKVPDKPEISAFHHRETMAEMALKEFHPWLIPSSIRNMTAEVLGRASAKVKGKKVLIMGATPVEQRAFCDIAAFDLLFAMNPGIKWYYLTGSDKINGYGKKDEEQLVHYTLHKNNVSVLYFERDDEPVDLKCIAMRAWLQKLWDLGMFTKSEISSYSGLSATGLRKMIINGDEQALNEANPDEIEYAKNMVLGLYRLNDAVKKDPNLRQTPEYQAQIDQLRAAGIID